MKINLNYFTSGTLVKVIKNVINVLVVLYYDHSDHKKNEEIRLPGGTFQFIDLLSALEEVGQRIGLSFEKNSWLTQEIRKISDRYVSTISTMPSTNNAQKMAIREVFLRAVKQAEDHVESVVYGSEKIRILQNECKLQTLKRELGEECATVSCVDPTECGFTKRGEHFQFPYLVMESDTPDEYNGSSDPDIKESRFIPLSEMKDILYKNHQPFLNNTLSQLSQIWSYDKDMSKFVVELNTCLGVNV